MFSSDLAGTVVVAAILISLLRCPAAASSKFDGKWAGNTSQGKEFRFTVSGGLITSSYIEFDLTVRTQLDLSGGWKYRREPWSQNIRTQFFRFDRGKGHSFGQV